MLGTTADPQMMILGAFLVGLSAGTEYGLVPFCIPRCFGFKAYGEIYGVIFGMIMFLPRFHRADDGPFDAAVVTDGSGKHSPTQTRALT